MRVENEYSGKVEVKCFCEKLYPTTIEDAFAVTSETIVNILDNSKLDDVFSEDGLNSLYNYKFYESMVIYTFVGITVLYSVLMCEAKNLDKNDINDYEK